MNESVNHCGNISVTNAELIEDEAVDYCPTISWGVVIVFTCILTISPFCTLLWIRFLKDRPLNMQCVTYKLTEDLLKLNFLYVLTWSLLAMMFKMSEIYRNVFALRELVKYLTVTEAALMYYILLYLCLIASLRMYRSKYHILDPVEEYFGEDEGTSIMYIRLIIFLLIMFVLGIFYMKSVIPLIYYQLIRKDHKWEDVPRGSRLVYFVDMGLWTICSVFLITAKIFQWIEDAKQEDNLVEIGVIKRTDDTSSDSSQSGSLEANQELPENAQVSFGKFNFDFKKTSLPNFLYLGSGLLVILLMSLQYLGIIYLDVWWILTGFVGMQGVVIPGVLILWYENVRNYSWRNMKDRMDDARNWAHGLMSSISQSTNRVAPEMR